MPGASGGNAPVKPLPVGSYKGNFTSRGAAAPRSKSSAPQIKQTKTQRAALIKAVREAVKKVSIRLDKLPQEHAPATHLPPIAKIPKLSITKGK